MKKQNSNRAYNFSDPDLYLKCVEHIRYAKRELILFKRYGYDEQRLKSFANQCVKFKNLPSDDELVGDQMIVTDKKYAKGEALKGAIRSIMTRVAIKYNNRSGRYRKFGASKLGDMSDAHLLLCARRVVRVSRQQLDFLADVGLNENNIGRVVESAKIFENAIHIQQDRIHDRDIAVEIRTEKGNKLYDELITLCNIGKDIWGESDPVKYENYVLYESNNDQKKERKKLNLEKE